MPKVTMLSTMKGCLDGINATEFIKGQTYDLPQDLYNDFASLGVIAPCLDDISYSDSNMLKNEKSEIAAQKNKAHKSSPKNKSALGE